MTPIGAPRSACVNFRVIKEKGVRVSKSSHAPVSLRRCAEATRARPLRAKGSGTRAARLTGLLAIGLLALLMVPAFASAAVPAHAFKEVFGSLAQPELSKPAGLAVDPSTGDVYVIDLEDQTLHRFKSNGQPAPFSALAGSNVIDGAGGADEVPVFKEILSSQGGITKEVQVAVAPPGSAGNTAGDIYVTNAGDGQIDVFATTGAFVGSYVDGASPSYPCGVSVGPAGEVYLGDRENGIHKLIPSAPATFTEAAGSPFSAANVCNVAAGYGPSAGSVFYTSYGHNVFKLNASTGSPDYQVFAGNVLGGVSVDPATGYLYLGTEATIEEFDVSGSVAATLISSTELEIEIYGNAVDFGSGDLYITGGGNHKLEVFDPITKSLNVPIVGAGGVECEDQGTVSFGPCASSYGEGRTVKLKATAGAGSSFGGWSEFSGSGAVTTPCAGAVTECEVKFDGDISGKATFVPNPHVTLTVGKLGNGSGAISSVPGGIECGARCEAEYEAGTIVTLEATAAAGSTFVEWTGCDSVSGPVCHVTVEAAKTVDAVFGIAQQSVTVSGETTVTATPGKTPAGSTPPPLPPPPAPVVGEARAAGGILRVSANVASVKLACSGAGACRGVLKLYAGVPQGNKGKKVTKLIGESSFSIGQGASATIKVKITNSQVKRELNKGHTVKAQVRGTGIRSGTLVLRTANKRHEVGGKH